MSTTPNEPQDPRSAVPADPNTGDPRVAGHGGVDGVPAGQPYAEPQNSGQQYGQAGGKYGTAEYNPGQYTGVTERPGTLDKLLKLTMASLGIYVLSGMVGLIAVSTIEMAGKADGVGGPAGSIISLIIGIALYLLVWTNLKKGKNWARILGTVFAAIAILGGLFGLIGTFVYPAPWNIIMVVLALLKVVVDILWIVTAYKAPTSAWFTQNQVQR
ncbi:hypothetical protein [uncultured Kocuria sp.]|uniref:hypothetical protein n=1 Tax=uncultured Kocuria sp. TaxID=259305 RepID=UPI0025E4A499|nr:hypothetical protein [uncultured Kocuria sp.]